MSAVKKKNYGIELTEDNLLNINGGINGGLDRMRVQCPVDGCNFECNTFHEMNIHMRTNHPERC
ncbi:MAG: hypothetical protein IJT21_07605 [Synergistaceae bacterium]|nr:hypothetical protein [Synergistaceae bacterium]